MQYVTLGSDFEIYVQSYPRNVVKKIMNVFLQIQLTDPGQRRQHFTSGSDSTGKCEYHAVPFSRKFAWPRAMIILTISYTWTYFDLHISNAMNV